MRGLFEEDVEGCGQHAHPGSFIICRAKLILHIKAPVPTTAHVAAVQELHEELEHGVEGTQCRARPRHPQKAAEHAPTDGQLPAVAPGDDGVEAKVKDFPLRVMWREADAKTHRHPVVRRFPTDDALEALERLRPEAVVRGLRCEDPLDGLKSPVDPGDQLARGAPVGLGEQLPGLVVEVGSAQAARDRLRVGGGPRWRLLALHRLVSRALPPGPRAGVGVGALVLRGHNSGAQSGSLSVVYAVGGVNGFVCIAACARRIA
ncbi:tRNA (N6-isopentenyl adenosine(37)-C2)-methylthiotransferase MiaB [Babesia caballi]|uniref:tRNA (N6-isopentenyl adenosine(37)-C2)-methylthiotransferase MiaB n=1 Tax=Babesia caballi TaxID=5871 RepID=A0AAV4LSJ6_BABCB|nr:tRNA (N6-isopentenyl adenosine(37)-C2)-methylthiotransferase MiaB [Babesia caballi]